MRKVFYILLIATAFLIPTEPQNLESLRPVEVVRVSKMGNVIRIETDTDDAGEGTTVERALVDLKATALGTVYLDTAEYLLITEGAMELIDGLRPYLKGSTRLCWIEQEVNLETVAEYLRAHPPKMQLKCYKTGQKLQKLELKIGSISS